MKKKLIIDFKDELDIKFKLNSGVIAKNIILNIAGKEKTYNLSKIEDYYSFKVPHSFFEDKIGKVLFFFTYIGKNGIEKIENFSKFKKFRLLNNKVKKIENRYILINQTKKRNFGLIITKNLKKSVLSTENLLKSIKKNNKHLLIKGLFKSFLLPIEKIEMSLEGRKFSKFVFPINYKLHGEYLDEYRFFSRIEINSDIEEDIYDLFVFVYLDGIKKPFKIRFGKTKFMDRIFLKDFTFEDEKNTIFVSPYLTFSRAVVSFEIEKISNNILKSIKNIKMDKNRDIWIVGERRYKAQDNGKAFFEYMRKNHPEKEVYYVIDFKSPEYNNIKHLGNVVDFKSKKHFELCLKATHFFCSHYIDYLYPLRSKNFKSKIKAKKIFLQHGVLGVKNLNKIYSNQKEIFDADMFCVSTEREKQIVIDDFGFNEAQVKLTGIPRFDSLFKNDIKIKRQLLIIPTWREWLQNVDLFLESEYFRIYQDLLFNKELIDSCREKNVGIVFCLHPNMQQYSSFFKSEYVKIVFQGEVDVQKLIKESSIMITDYSSVAFDFTFLNKPVIYYQFDQKRFLGDAGSHLDLERELPGKIVNSEKHLIKEFKNYLKNDFKMSEEYENRAKKLLEYKDSENCKRIFNETLNFKFKPSIIEKIKLTETYEKAFNRFRRSMPYFPLMKILYRIFKLFPLKDRYVFESGLGRQYSDSPRAIYEELIKEKDVSCIWAYNKTSFVHPMNTKVVKRLSPEYYYYLATSKYWINNQNFPSYVTKRKNTKYIQTWHGTPLKRMLNDIRQIKGRDKGYYNRVTKSIKQWSYLLSQNSYSSEKFRTAFKYNGPILEECYPRNDILIRPKEKNLIIDKIRNYYSISDHDKKIILYAPTFRDNNKIKNKFQANIPIDFKDFYKEFEKEYILLIRLHSIVSSNLKIPIEYKDTIINVSDYPDIQELYLMTDILITDYSSSFFDFAILEKPMLFYAYDFEEYINNTRGIYLDYNKEVPGKIVKNQEELFDGIKDIKLLEQEYKPKLLKFKETYNNTNRNASEYVVKKLLLD